MSFVNLFRKRKKEVTLETITSEIQDNNLPKAVFEDEELQVAVGQWIGILPSQKVYGSSGLTMYTHLDSSELMQESDITTDRLKEIERKFGSILRMIGVNCTETCVLRNYNKDNFSFSCHFNNTGDDANISLKYGFMMGTFPKLIINYQSFNKTYEYLDEYDDRPMQMVLRHFTIKNPSNGLEYYNGVSPYSLFVTCKSRTNEIRIYIDYPEELKNSNDNLYFDEAKLQETLLSVVFPIKIDELYKDVLAASFKDVSTYKSFRIKVSKIVVDKKQENHEITDMIALKNGQLVNFIITRGEKTISFDNLNNWSYKTPKLSVSQDNNGMTNYNLSCIPIDKISSLTSSSIQVNAANEEVEQIKELAKSMIKK